MRKGCLLSLALIPVALLAQPAIEPVEKPRPSATEQSGMVEAVRRKAIEYSRNLPNFLCTQLTKRYAAKPPKPGQEPAWKLADSLEIQLSFFDQQEKYKLVKLNGKPTKKTMEQLSGGKWKGDFGSTLQSVFAPSSMAFFSWGQWGKLEGRPVAVFLYGIDVSHAAFGTTISRNGRRVHIDWGCEGQIVVDAQTLEVLRITVDSVGLPETSPVGEVHLLLEYGRQRVGEQEFLLPLRSSHWSMSSNGAPQKSETLFTEYRKFAAESGIKFDAQ